MVTEPLCPAFGQDADVSRPHKFARALQEKGAAVIDHIDSISIQIWPGDARAAAHANVIGAIHAGATRAPVYEQVIIAATSPKIRGLDRTMIGQLNSRRIGGQAQPVAWIKLHQIDAAPIRAKG